MTLLPETYLGCPIDLQSDHAPVWTQGRGARRSMGGGAGQESGLGRDRFWHKPEVPECPLYGRCSGISGRWVDNAFR